MTKADDAAIQTAARALPLRGLAILPGDPAYDDARRVWNAMHDRQPAVIVRADDAADVRTALAFGQAHGLPIAIRAGGHNVAGNGTVEDGLVIDLGAMQGVRVDAATETVTVGPGVTLGGLDRETQRFGLAVPVGVISGTGVAGLTLGGGVGWLTRARGLTIDSLLGADVVTATGEVLRAAPDGDAELLWGLKGGGGNFGVVTSLTFRAYPLGPQVLTGNFIYERAHWLAALEAYAAWTADLPDALTSIASFLIPPASFDLGSDVILVIGFTWADPDRTGADRLAAALRAAAPPDAEVYEPTDWLAWQSAVDELFPKGVRAYWKNASLGGLSRGAIEAIVEHAPGLPALGSGFDIHHMGGAVRRVADDATAFPNRAAPYWVNMYGVWHDAVDDERGKAWARGFHAALAPYAEAGLYVNFLGADAGTDARGQALAAYGPATLERLTDLKRRLDPGNVFRLNHNIPPD